MHTTTVTHRQLLIKNRTIQKAVYLVLLFLCCFPFITSPIALLLGIMAAQCTGQPFKRYTQPATSLLLQASVVGLGFGITAQSALQAGRQGIAVTVISIILTLLGGWWLGRKLKVDNKAAFLVAAGTAICGGSAIAAIAPVIKAEERQTSVALGVVFILNGVALFLFPVLGNMLHLTDTQFGVWCAVAIHDTSSVTGAAARYGAHALEVATTVKLARALWIIPLALLSGVLFRNKEARIRVPWFILFFITAIILHTYVSFLQPLTYYIPQLSKAGLTLCLFLIGNNLTGDAVRAAGVKPLCLGVLLWVIIALVNLWLVEVIMW